MRIGKPLLLVLTPIGVVSGLYEAWRFSPGLAALMLALLTVVGAGVGTIVGTVRAEKAAEEERANAPAVVAVGRAEQFQSSSKGSDRERSV